MSKFFRRFKLDGLLVEKPEFYIGLVLMLIAVAVIRWLAPSTIPFRMWEFFRFDWDWAELKTIPWWFFLIIPALTTIALANSENSFRENVELAHSFKGRLTTSVLAGIFEEVSFRWLLFYLAIFMFAIEQKFIDWASTFGFIHAILSMHWFWALILIVLANLVGLVGLTLAVGDNITCIFRILGIAILVPVAILDIAVILFIGKWWYTDIVFPIVNWITFGRFADVFAMAWPVGAAMITVNFDFGKGHIYQGPIGWAHSWISGMLFFWFTLHFGLFPAMMIHAVFDMTMDTILTADAVAELANR